MTIDTQHIASSRVHWSVIYEKLDRIVREHRFTIAVIFPLVGAGLLLASAEGLLPARWAFNPILILIGVTVMRSPLIVGLLPLINRRAVLALGGLAGYTYCIEYIGVRTGWPYGPFSYGISLGPMVEGIPVSLPILFIPLVLNAYLVWMLLLNSGLFLRFIAIVPTVVLMDLVLDPGAVALGFWAFDAGGAFYGVPLTNYLGWILSATVAFVLIEAAFGTNAIRVRAENCPYILDDFVSFVILWGAINLWFGQWIPVLGTMLLGAFIFISIVQRDQKSSAGKRQ